MRAAGSAFACVPACRLLELGLLPRHAALAQSRVTAGSHHLPHTLVLTPATSPAKPGTWLTGLSAPLRGRSSSEQPRRENLGSSCYFIQIPLHLIPSLPIPPPLLSCSSLCPCPQRLLSPPWPVYG